MSQAPSFLYSNRALYHWAMRLLYGRFFDARYLAIAAEVPENSEVVDVCAGDCHLYLKYLHRKSVKYLGLDISPRLVRWAQKRGVLVREFNVWEDEVPTGEIVIMQASLYQFVPRANVIVHKLLAAARHEVIISEPIRNVSASANPFLAKLGHRLTVPSSARDFYSGQRFDRQSLADFFSSFQAFERSFIIPGGREMVGIFRGQCHH